MKKTGGKNKKTKKEKGKNKTKKGNILKIFALYEIIISLVVVGLYLYFILMSVIYKIPFYPSSSIPVFTYELVPILGIIAGILLLKNKKSGLYLSYIWVILQLIQIKIGSSFITCKQLLGYYVYLKFFEGYAFLGLNLVAVVLLLILIYYRKKEIIDK